MKYGELTIEFSLGIGLFVQYSPMACIGLARLEWLQERLGIFEIISQELQAL